MLSKTWYRNASIGHLEGQVEILKNEIEYLRRQVETEKNDRREVQRRLDKVLQIETSEKEEGPYDSGIRAVGRSAGSRIRSLIEDDEVPEDQDIHPSDFLEP